MRLWLLLLAACGAAAPRLDAPSATCPAAGRAAVVPHHPTRGGIGGVVLDRDCRAAAGIDVVVRSPGARDDHGATTNEAGRFVIDDLPRGTYDLIFIADTAMWEIHGVAVQPGAFVHLQTQQPDPLELGS